MKKSAFWAGWIGLAVFGLAATGQAGTIVRSAVGSFESLDCQGQPVEISGTSSQFELRGSCPTLSIKGSDITVQVEKVGSIRIEGAGNRVVWSQALGGPRPKITEQGAGNKIVQGKWAGKRTDRNPATERRLQPVAGEKNAAKAGGRGGSLEVNTAGVSVKIGTRDDRPRERHADAGPESAAPEKPWREDQPRYEDEGKDSGRDIEINGNGKERTVTCRGENVRITGNDLRVTVRGECREVTVSGNSNKVRVESVRSISVSGNDLEVAWVHGRHGKEPQIAEWGNDNKIYRIPSLVSDSPR